jgi:fructokinase
MVRLAFGGIYMYDVIAFGELLIDITSYQSSDSCQILFEQNPGGAPANVLAAISKLGGKTSFAWEKSETI